MEKFVMNKLDKSSYILAYIKIEGNFVVLG